MPGPSDKAPIDVPRMTSHALAMRPGTRRIFVGVSALAVTAATGIGALVAYAGHFVAHEGPIGASAAAFWGGVGAFVAALLGTIAVPVARRVLISRADVRLVEAASPVHPLLKRLMTEAPGTYAHSLATASLAESGAEAIGADPLVARVGAYYHDIGKIRQPCFFFENVAEDVNPHDSEDPSLSALIIASHVTDGLELAEEYELPQRVYDIIREHHGTSLIRYFFHKASAEGAEVVEADFRYHGGRPASREAALVMLADACEAAVRALTAPTADEIAMVVRGVVAEKTDDHQLEHAGLTEGDLETVSQMYSRMLVSMLHARCEYPRPLSGTGKVGHADQRRQPSRA